MTLLTHLAEASVRALALAAVAGLLSLFVRRTAARHAVWTAVLAGMLFLYAGAALLPPLKLTLLPPAPRAVPVARLPFDGPAFGATPRPAPPKPAKTNWTPGLLLAIYSAGALLLGARMAAGWIAVRRVVRDSIETDDKVRVSAAVTVPVSVGILHPLILLPANSTEWSLEKRRAVLEHERAHVRRRDPLIAVLAALNLCLFWFHPLAWWLERHLASLAEHAADDASILVIGDRQTYAEALLDVAAALPASGARIAFSAVPMARNTHLTARVERILDAGRVLSPGLTQGAVLAVAACAAPILYTAAAFQVTRAPAQPDFTETLPYELRLMVAGTRLTAPEAEKLEDVLKTNPDDLDSRTRLISYYFVNAMPARRVPHVHWLIEHHPDAEVFTSRVTSTEPYYGTEEAEKQLWLKAAQSSSNSRVWATSADFLARNGDRDQAEQLLLRALAEQPADPGFSRRLAGLYISAIVNNPQAPFAAHARQALETTNNQIVAREAVRTLAMFDPGLAGRIAERAGIDPPIFLKPMHEVQPVYPALAKQSRIEGVVRLKVTVARNGSVAAVAVEGGHPLLIPAAVEAVKQWRYVFNDRERTASVEIPFRLDQAPESAPATAAPVPRLQHRTDPVYPPLALQARLQGVVRLKLNVGADGEIAGVQVVAGHPLLVPAAMEAVKQWRYEFWHESSTITVDVPFVLP